MKRLYRAAAHRKLGGVCGGLGVYFGVDPVFFRLLFLVLLCCGGLGLVAYLALWILVPLEGTAREVRGPRRLCRSCAERKLAGVCGGLGEYSDVDPVLFRVLFVVLAFMGGLGILLYVAFWLAMPEAPAAAPEVTQPG